MQGQQQDKLGKARSGHVYVAEVGPDTGISLPGPAALKSKIQYRKM